MEKGTIIELRIDDMLDDGRAFGRYDGLAVFVSGGAGKNGKRIAGAVPGDVVKARVAKVKKSSVEASLAEIVEPSADRIAAECPYAAECGGCSLQEMNYDAQKELKRSQVIAKLRRLGGIEEPNVLEMEGAETLRYYRNKAVFAVGPHGEVGFRKGKSHYVIDIEDCMLQSDPAMVCADALRTWIRRNKGKSSGITQMTVRTAQGTGEVMAVLESENREVKGIEDLVEMLDVAVASLSPAADPDDYNAEGTNRPETDLLYSLESVAVIHKGKCRIVAGKPTITEEITRPDGKMVRFEISPQSFYQVNPEQMVRLYDKAAEYADLRGGETVLDLYCGAGTIGIWILDDLRGRNEEALADTHVIGIESVRPAVIDANRNSVINGLVGTRYICGKAEEELPGMMDLAKLYKWNEVNERVEREPEIRIDKVDVAILDPPRAGCDEALLSAVALAEPDRIVYVSCDPGTLARDVKYLAGKGYEFIEAVPFDQFPWTSHTEVCCLLMRISNGEA